MSLISIPAKEDVIKRAHHHVTLSHYVSADALRDNKVSISDKLLDVAKPQHYSKLSHEESGCFYRPVTIVYHQIV